MQRFKVRFRPLAEADLIALYDRVAGSEVVIVRIFYGGRDYERRLREP